MLLSYCHSCFRPYYCSAFSIKLPVRNNNLKIIHNSRNIMTSLHSSAQSSDEMPLLQAEENRQPISHNQNNNQNNTTTKNTNNITKANVDETTPKKMHTITVCMSIPESETRCWELVSKARKQLKDPGYYRWPPHANLLYPFIHVKSIKEHSFDDDPSLLVDPEIIQKLRSATRHCEPFQVSLNKLGTFGGAKRGVLWLYPHSFRGDDNNDNNEVSSKNQGHPGDTENNNGSNKNTNEPLVQLQSLLQEQFPFCNDQQKVAGQYNPHITISHFVNLDAALEGKSQMEEWWPISPPVQFCLEEIYLLQRKGDDGQFLRLASIPLGDNNKEVIIHDPPKPFSYMPTEEEDWVREERMQLKARRNRRGRHRGTSGERKPTTDTPEQIAAKRAERAAKREQREIKEAEKSSNDGE